MFNTGSYTEIITGSATTHGLASFDDFRYQILDMTNITEADFTVKDIERLAALDQAASKTNPHLKVAVATIHEEVAALSYLYQAETISSPWKTKVFPCFNEAMDWALAGS
jgi:hypothetical protein